MIPVLIDLVVLTMIGRCLWSMRDDLWEILKDFDTNTKSEENN